MGRIEKQTTELFPHYAKGGRTKRILEEKWGNDGYAFWFKLLELLCVSEGHYYDYSNAANRLYLEAYMRLDKPTVKEIIEALIDLNQLDKDLWEKHQIIWCQSLVDNLAGQYNKRKGILPEKPVFEKTESEPAAQSDAEQMRLAEVESVEKPAKEKKPKKPEKKQFAEFVSLTEEEYDKLVKQYGEVAAKRMVEVLDNYKGSSGKKYTSDYRAILNWVVQRVAEEEKRGVTTSEQFGKNRSADTGGFRASGGFKNG